MMSAPSSGSSSFCAQFFEDLLSGAALVTGNIGADHRFISISARILRIPGAPDLGDNAAAARQPLPHWHPDDEREVRGKRIGSTRPMNDSRAEKTGFTDIT